MRGRGADIRAISTVLRRLRRRAREEAEIRGESNHSLTVVALQENGRGSVIPRSWLAVHGVVRGERRCADLR